VRVTPVSGIVGHAATGVLVVVELAELEAETEALDENETVTVPLG
jgi:hypothetical protein